MLGLRPDVSKEALSTISTHIALTNSITAVTIVNREKNALNLEWKDYQRFPFLSSPRGKRSLPTLNVITGIVLSTCSVDATKESDRLGRLLNHSRTDANCATRLVSIKDKPYLILETVRDVKAGEELLYDYGERSKDVLQYHQWLKS